MATTTVICGERWSRGYMVSVWGDATPEQAETLMDASVEKFHALAAAAGYEEIAWLPEISEVYGTYEREYPPEDFPETLESWREQACNWVWENRDTIIGE